MEDDIASEPRLRCRRRSARRPPARWARSAKQDVGGARRRAGARSRARHGVAGSADAGPGTERPQRRTPERPAERPAANANGQQSQQAGQQGSQANKVSREAAMANQGGTGSAGLRRSAGPAGRPRRQRRQPERTGRLRRRAQLGRTQRLRTLGSERHPPVARRSTAIGPTTPTRCAGSCRQRERPSASSTTSFAICRMFDNDRPLHRSAGPREAAGGRDRSSEEVRIRPAAQDGKRQRFAVAVGIRSGARRVPSGDRMHYRSLGRNSSCSSVHAEAESESPVSRVFRLLTRRARIQQAGAVVAWLDGPEPASSSSSKPAAILPVWIFPKGHVEDGETAGADRAPRNPGRSRRDRPHPRPAWRARIRVRQRPAAARRSKLLVELLGDAAWSERAAVRLGHLRRNPRPNRVPLRARRLLCPSTLASAVPSPGSLQRRRQRLSLFGWAASSPTC